jgi:hypothetical protein
LIISRNKLRLLRYTKRTTNLFIESLKFILNYQRIFREVVKEAKKKEIDRFVLSAKNKNKVTEESKNQLDATRYFILLHIGSKCFKYYYAHHQQLTTVMFSKHWSCFSWFAVCWRWGAVRLVWCLGCRLKQNCVSACNIEQTKNDTTNVVNNTIVASSWWWA